MGLARRSSLRGHHGYQGDNERTMWPWRDWVVRAFNDNIPFDQFTIWQLAGDLLPNATPDQRLATAFCRNHMINGEGGKNSRGKSGRLRHGHDRDHGNRLARSDAQLQSLSRSQIRSDSSERVLPALCLLQSDAGRWEWRQPTNRSCSADSQSTAVRWNSISCQRG